MDISIQRLVEYATVRFSDPTDYRLDEFILSILWERKDLPRWAIVLMGTGHATHRPLLISLSCSLRKSHNLVCLTNSKQHRLINLGKEFTSNSFFNYFYLARGRGRWQTLVLRYWTKLTKLQSLSTCIGSAI